MEGMKIMADVDAELRSTISDGQGYPVLWEDTQSSSYVPHESRSIRFTQDVLFPALKV